MFEITVRIEAPALADAINSLAAAIAGNIELLLDRSRSQIAAGMDTTPAIPPVQNYQATIAAIQPVALASHLVAAPVAPVTNIAPPVETPAQVPTTAPTYTMEQLAVAATQLVDAGRRTDLVNLLAQFGVQALTALDKGQYGNFATALRQMGARL